MISLDASTKAILLEKINPEWNTFLESRYKLQLKNAGRGHWVVPCPFHKENTASGHFRLANGTINYPHYKCYGCGEFLNPIDFVMQMEGLSFIDACKILGGFIGMEITTEPKNPKHEAYKDKMSEHARRYSRNLDDPRYTSARGYLTKERGLTEETLKRFMIGVVPSDEFKNRNDISNIAERIAFPIFEHKLVTESKCVGMGYRTLKDSSPVWDKQTDPKYKNDATTTGDLEGVFKKEEYLYGYQYAFAAIRKMQYAILVEGYVDVLSLHQSGMVNTVGLMGTAFTEKQIDILRKLTSNIILFLDGDGPGVAHMVKYVPTLLEKGFSVKIIKADSGKDPSDVCTSLKFNRADVMGYVMKNSEPAVNVIISYYTNEYEKTVIKERTRVLNAVLPIVEKCTLAEKMVFENMLMKKLDMK